MLKLSNSINNKDVFSLRTGGIIGHVYDTLINPNNLKIEGLMTKDKFSNDTKILLYQDIRELSPKGYIVNDLDSLSNIEDLVRLADIIDLNYQLIGKGVVTVNGDKVGKVTDYAVEIETMYIQKIYATQPIIKNFSGGNLSIDRSQINEVNDKRIIINDLLANSPATAPATA